MLVIQGLLDNLGDLPLIGYARVFADVQDHLRSLASLHLQIM